MKVSELTRLLNELQTEHGDVEVLGQTSGCCPHGHEIKSVAMGVSTNRYTENEIGKIVMRLG